MNDDRPRLAMYWAASCGGCEVSLLNVHEGLLEIERDFRFVFCPCLLDSKKADLEALPDGAIDFTLFNGGLRNEENLEMARLLRRKSRYLIAFGACAATGGIPALANEHGVEELFDRCYPAEAGNPQRTRPAAASSVGPHLLTLPPLLPRVLALSEAVAVDGILPGCPPEPPRIMELLRELASGGEAVPGPLREPACRALCEECGREKRGTAAPRLLRPHEGVPESGWCLLEQGFLCLGGATRGGCGALCPAAAMPCTGCYGALDRDADPGAGALVALAGALGSKRHGTDEDALRAEVAAGLAAVADPLGTCYRYTMAASVLRQPTAEEEA